MDRTARRRIDVEKAFRDARTEEARDDVEAVLPPEAIPVLAVPRAEVPWEELDELSTRLVLRIDAATKTLALVADAGASPDEGARALSELVRRGVVRLVLPAAEGDPLIVVKRVSDV